MKPKLVATIKTGDLPHGIWGSGDGTRVYVGLENGDAVQAIDTLTNQIVATIPVGQLPQALVYVPGAATSDNQAANLTPLGVSARAIHIALVPPDGSSAPAQASVSINSLGLIDNIQIAATGLEPGKKYKLALVGDRDRQDLVTFTAGIGGVAIVQTLGPMKKIVTGSPTVAPLKLAVFSDQPGAVSLVLQQNGLVPNTPQ